MPTVSDILAASAEKWPESPAVIEKHTTITYRALLQRVETTRERLCELGVAPGQGIGILIPDGIDFLAAAFAASACGAVVVPLYHQSPRAELQQYLSLPVLHAVIAKEAEPPIIQGTEFPVEAGGNAPLRFIRTETPTTQPCAPHIADAAFVRFTSGTTGESKGTVLSHQAIFERITATNRALQLSHDDIVLSVLPMAFHFFVSIMLYLSRGASIVVGSDFSAEEILAAANKYRITLLYASPLHYRALAGDFSGQKLPKTLRLILATSTSLHSGVAQKFFERFRRPISQAYGIIEVGLPIVNLDHPDRQPCSVGRPLPDYEIALLNPRHAPIAPGETGELAIRGPGMFSGYLHPPQRREEVLRDGWFHTGDLARRDAEGCIEIVGRLQSVIETSKGKVHPEEIEAVLENHPEVFKSRVSGRLVATSGADSKANPVVLHADVVPANPDSPPSPEALTAFCRNHLSPEKVPVSMAIVSAVPETASGKIARGKR